MLDARHVPVSIHAPAREATSACRCTVVRRATGFNPRPRAGSDTAAADATSTTGFQSTPPRGKRPGGAVPAGRGPRFNPRPRAGSDQMVSCWSLIRSGFNPRPRAGSDIACSSWSTLTMSFNPRPRAGSDASDSTGSAAGCSFNPRPRAGSDNLHLENCDALWLLFQSTPPRGKRPPAAPRRRWCCRCFNPRPRAGSDRRPATRRSRSSSRSFNPRPRAGSDARVYGIFCYLSVVSIHAPAREATLVELLEDAGHARVSIHAPAREATRRGRSGGRAPCCFNPRPRAGSDALVARDSAEAKVSIHAPAREATVSS